VTTRRWVVAGLAVVAAAGMATAACGTKSDDTGTSTSTPSPTPAAPKDVLVASAAELGKQSFTFTIKDADATGQGTVDPTKKSGQIKADFSDATSGVKFTLDLIVVAQDSYLKLDFGALKVPGLPPKDKWQHLDRSKLKDPGDLDIDIGEKADPAGAADIFNGIVSAQSAGDRRYTGTVDLTKATDADLVDEDIVKELGDAAKAVPFEATVDDKGRLATLKIEIPASGKVKAQTWQVTYGAYGAAPTIEKPPAAQVQEAPQSLYDLLNS
jgi:hypothetical protein